MAHAVHSAALEGFSRQAERYARGRPDYPPQVLDWLRGTLRLGPGRRTVDVGAGTGKFTALLAQSGAEVSAVEPVDAMRAQLSARLPQVRALAGTADRLPLADGAADAIVCAQAFHWFATPEALADMHRVLAPGGRLGLVWNVRDESVDWVAQLTRIITPHEGDAPRFHTGRWRDPFAQQALFGPLQVMRLPHRHVGPPAEVVLDRFMSVSFIAALPANERDAVAARIQALIDTHPALQAAEVAFPYETQCWWAERLPGRQA